MTTFIAPRTILLREGVEALLIVIGIIAFAKATMCCPMCTVADQRTGGGRPDVGGSNVSDHHRASREVS
jgi:hypothetical protein